MLWNRLTPSKVESVSTIFPVLDDIVLLLDTNDPLSQPVGSTWFDLSGNGFDGTLTNGATFVPSSAGSLGPELITNGVDWTGASGTTPPDGWFTGLTLTLYSVTAGGALRVDRNGDTALNTNQSITGLTIGNQYSITYDIVDYGGGNIFLAVGSASGTTSVNVSSATDTGIIDFTANATTMTFGFRPSSSTTQIIEIDNVSIKENIPAEYNHISFDGDDDCVFLGSVPLGSKLQLSSPAGGGLSISCAVYFNGVGDNYQRVIDKSTSGVGTDGYCFYKNGIASNSPDDMLYQTTDASSFSAASSNAIVPALWQIWTFTLNTSTNAWVFYLNSSSVSSGTKSGLVPPNAVADMRLGTWNHSTGRELNGKIGFIAIHEKELTSTEVSTIHSLYMDYYGL